MADLVRLIILILFLPLIIIFIGPLLVLAVFRGRQRMGPITLSSTHYNWVGRIGIFMLGLAIWLLVWSGLAWLVVSATSLVPVMVQIPPTEAAVIELVVEPTMMLTPSPSVVPATSTQTPTPAPPTPTFTPSPTPTLGPIVPAAQVTPTATPTPVPTSTPGPTFTPTPLFNEILATNTPNAVLTATGTRPILRATFTPAERQAAIDTLEEANVLLRNAIGQANEENIEKLGEIWRGQGLVKTIDFASELYERYAKPFTVSFEYMTPPRISEEAAAGELVVTSREQWRYGGPTMVNEEAFEFIYTLSPEDGRWVITKYSYRNLPLPTPTAILLDNPATATLVPPKELKTGE